MHYIYLVEVLMLVTEFRSLSVNRCFGIAIGMTMLKLAHMKIDEEE